MPITNNVVSSNPAHGEVYSIQLYMIKFASDLRQVGSFLRELRFHPPIKLTTKIKTEILLKVTSNTITQNPNKWVMISIRCTEKIHSIVPRYLHQMFQVCIHIICGNVTDIVCFSSDIRFVRKFFCTFTRLRFA